MSLKYSKVERIYIQVFAAGVVVSELGDGIEIETVAVGVVLTTS